MYSWHLISTRMYFEVRAYYRGRLTSVFVYADSGKAAIKMARAELPRGARYVAIAS